MKFGLGQLFRNTPPALANLGHALVAATVGITVTDFSAFPKLQIGLQLSTLGGYFLVNLFGTNTKK